MSDTPASGARNHRASALLILEAAHRRIPLEPILLTPGIHILGSDPDCTSVVKWQGVRPRHCEITVQNGSVVLKAIDPRTWLNKGPVTEAKLRVGDRLILGPLELNVTEFPAPRAFDDEPPPERISAQHRHPVLSTNAKGSGDLREKPLPEVQEQLRLPPPNIAAQDSSTNDAKFPAAPSHHDARRAEERARSAESHLETAEELLASLLEECAAGGTPDSHRTGIMDAETRARVRKAAVLEDLLELVQTQAEEVRRAEDAVTKRQRALLEVDQWQSARHAEWETQSLEWEQRAAAIATDVRRLDADQFALTVAQEALARRLAEVAEREAAVAADRELQQLRELERVERVAALDARAASLESLAQRLELQDQHLQECADELRRREEGMAAEESAQLQKRRDLEAEELRLDEERRGLERARQFVLMERQELETGRQSFEAERLRTVALKEEQDRREAQLQARDERLTAEATRLSDWKRTLENDQADWRSRLAEAEESARQTRAETERLAQIDREYHERHDRLVVAELQNATWYERQTAERSELDRLHAKACAALEALETATEQIARQSAELEDLRSTLRMTQLEHADWYEKSVVERAECLRQQETMAEAARKQAEESHFRIAAEREECAQNASRNEDQRRALEERASSLRQREQRLLEKIATFEAERNTWAETAPSRPSDEDCLKDAANAEPVRGSIEERHSPQWEERASALELRERALQADEFRLIEERSAMQAAREKLDEQSATIAECLAEIRASDEEFARQAAGLDAIRQELERREQEVATQSQRAAAQQAQFERQAAWLEQQSAELEALRIRISTDGEALRFERNPLEREQAELVAEPRSDQWVSTAADAAFPSSGGTHVARGFADATGHVPLPDRAGLPYGEPASEPSLDEERGEPSRKDGNCPLLDASIADALDRLDDEPIDGERSDFLARMEANALRARQMAAGLTSTLGDRPASFPPAWDRPLASVLSEDAVTDEVADEPAEADDERTLALRSQLAAMFDLPRDLGERSDPASEQDAEQPEMELDGDRTGDSSHEPETDAIDVEGLLASLKPRKDCLPSPERTATLASQKSVELTDIEDADSVAAYMQQLFARTRRSGDPFVPQETLSPARPKAPIVPAPAANARRHEPATQEMLDDANDAEIEVDGPKEPPQPIFKPDRDAIRANLDSLRAVANQNARSAIARHSQAQFRAKIWLRILLLSSALILATVSFVPTLMGRVELGVPGWAFVGVALVLAVEFAYSSARVVLRTNRAAKAIPRKPTDEPRTADDGEQAGTENRAASDTEGESSVAANRETACLQGPHAD